MSAPPRQRRLLAVLGPGMLVAATGVGAGDLATAGFAGGQLGTAVLWAIALGAFLKFVLTEGLTRWQLATGTSILEGVVRHLGPLASIVFLVYLLPWSFFVGAALISASGATAGALLAPLGLDADAGATRLGLGAAHALAGVALVWFGGFRLFERLMTIGVGLMFASVVVTALLLRPDPVAIAAGLVVPRIPALDAGGLTWTIALIGGVGGTLTIICYGYWIREEGRETTDDLGTCRVDLASGYAVTALFGMAMLVIASRMPEAASSGRGVGLIVGLADQLGATLGPAGRWTFLVGAWAAVASSLLGVWQAVPYVFADFVRLHRPTRAHTGSVDRTGLAYRGFLVALATVPLLQVHHPFRTVQKWYAVLGAAFIPLLALALLLLLGRSRWTGARWRNRPLTTVVLIAALVFFAVAGYLQVTAR